MWVSHVLFALICVLGAMRTPPFFTRYTITIFCQSGIIYTLYLSTCKVLGEVVGQGYASKEIGLALICKVALQQPETYIW